MAMNKATIKSNIKSTLNATGHYDFTETLGYAEEMINAIVDGIIDEITSNAKCSGSDSRGDSHDNVGIV